ncbi:heme exporter protein CcmD [Ancylobacter sp. 6x-1]|uniref:Heme exporter protein D n=1 Tax=Ancylobacter crimeensis TaxID=2579147 RepID=A0ABT0DFB0_9HYPH|nr:heme exporter protein CcmD [Ancylobacter crimeensis]MCK0198452.1 heme exporter protein CcmD [Ancylobacter crimeensis]
MLPDHAAFIIAAFAGSALVIGALIGWILLDGRAVRRSLDAMEARGVRRRSDRTERGS